MDGQPTREVLLALAALEHLVSTLDVPPMAPSLEVRALLALLYARGNVAREPFDAFWRHCREQLNGEDGDAYVRRAMARTGVIRIARALGINPFAQDVRYAIDRLVDQHRRDTDPEYRARARALDYLDEAVCTREIVATKGRPHTPAARQLMARRIAEGKMPDGTTW